MGRSWVLLPIDPPPNRNKKSLPLFDIPAFLEHFQDIISECVSVFVQETTGVVVNLSCIVTDPKTAVRYLQLDIKCIFLRSDRYNTKC